MDARRRKQLIEQYKARQPEMGVMRVRCIPTGDVFMGPTRNVVAGINGLRAELEGGGHPNRRLQGIWNEHGAEAFEMDIVETLDRRDDVDDYDGDLEELCAMCMEREPGAERIWKYWR
ncbi:MAG: GIY-YIG nuclease family protein [Coriobacteriales bacterium]|jgi:hypothetical protein